MGIMCNNDELMRLSTILEYLLKRGICGVIALKNTELILQSICSRRVLGHTNVINRKIGRSVPPAFARILIYIFSDLFLFQEWV